MNDRINHRYMVPADGTAMDVLYAWFRLCSYCWQREANVEPREILKRGVRYFVVDIEHEATNQWDIGDCHGDLFAAADDFNVDVKCWSSEGTKRLRLSETTETYRAMMAEEEKYGDR